MIDRLWAPWRYNYVSNSDGETGGCIFCAEGSDLWLFSTEHARVYLNKFPYNNGHLLIAPKRHIPSLGRLSEDEMSHLWKVVVMCQDVVSELMNPDGFNIGMNIGRVAGAGIDGHIHVHIVPRWNGDTNFMPVLADTKVISQSLDALKELLCKKLPCENK